MSPSDAQNTRRTRTMLVSFLGAIVRPLGDWMPIGGVVRLLAAVDLDEAGVRTAVSRLKQRDWLVADARGSVRGYRLTGIARDVLAAGDHVIWHPPAPADLAQGWCVVHFSIPEAARARRHQLRTRLATLGFGNLGSAVWIAPARLRPAAERVVAELGLVDSCALFVGDHVSGIELGTLVRTSWDLERIDRGYRDFVTTYTPVLRRSARPGEPAFASYLSLVDDWRTLPFQDPGLPVELVGPRWSGARAGALFERLVERLRDPALAYAAQVLETGPPRADTARAIRMPAARDG